MTTGAVNASVTGNVYTDSKLAIYQVDKVLLPLDIVLPSKAPALAPAKAKADKTKPSSSSSGDDAGAGGDDGEGGDKASPAEASGAGGNSMRFFQYVEGMLVAVVVSGVAMMM